jgi:hypothetical protein
MRRDVGTLGHVAHVAQIAVIDYLPIVLLVHGIEVAGLRLVDQIEQRRKGVAEIEAASAAVADLEHPFELLIERLGIVELWFLPGEGMPRRRLEAPLAA